jgi:HlyD family secretion protein
MLKPGMTAQVSFVAAQRDDVIRIPTAALRFKPPKDDKEDKKKKDAKAAEKKADAKSDGKPEVSNEAAKSATKTGGGESRQLAGPPSLGGGGGRRGVGTVYKVNERNELVPIQVRTGIASNQHTELVSGEVKAGDELVIRDLQDKSKK